MVRTKVLIFLGIFLLGGCTLLTPQNELRVTEYDGSGWYMTASGGAKGCRVVQSGTVDACLVYEGEKCYVVTPSCKGLKVPSGR